MSTTTNCPDCNSIQLFVPRPRETHAVVDLVCECKACGHSFVVATYTAVEWQEMKQRHRRHERIRRAAQRKRKVAR